MIIQAEEGLPRRVPVFRELCSLNLSKYVETAKSLLRLLAQQSHDEW